MLYEPQALDRACTSAFSLSAPRGAAAPRRASACAA
jgi:hypothetical protein